LYPISSISKYFCKNLEILFTDIDDTITTNGLITCSSFSAVWDLYKNKISVVPVTGRPAGWCDHIARMWPVKGIIGENGAFYFAYDRKRKKMMRRYLLSENERIEGQKKLIKIKERILKEVPDCGISADQSFRITDLAIDYKEDVEPFGKKEIEKICKILDKEKACYKISSIHINCWYGSFDKLKGVKTFLKDLYNKELSELQNRIVFIGDSPNDEPMFKEIKNSIAVSNINVFLNDLEYPPLYITNQESSLGFAEAVNEILKKRAK